MAKKQKKEYKYGSRARPLEWLTIRSYIQNIPHEDINVKWRRLIRGIDLDRDSPYFDILITPRPLNSEEIKGLELTPIVGRKLKTNLRG